MGKNIKKTIFYGVITYIICHLFLQPLLTPIRSTLISSLTKLPSLFSNYIYRTLGTHTTNVNAEIILLIIKIALVCIFIDAVRSLSINFLVKINILNKSEKLKIKKQHVILFLLLYILSVPLLYKENLKESLRYNFNFKMKVLAPYLSKQEEEELISKWTIMRNKQDHDKIHNILNKCGSENNITFIKK